LHGGLEKKNEKKMRGSSLHGGLEKKMHSGLEKRKLHSGLEKRKLHNGLEKRCRAPRRRAPGAP